MKSLWITPCILLAMACNNPGDKINSATTDSTGGRVENIPPATTVAADTGLAGCYGFEGGRDTVILQLERKGENVSGPLSYNYFEKDRNDGTLQGVVSGDLVTGFYLFKSEGVMSVRQEVFKVVNGNLVPGYGEVIQRNDSTFFRNPATLKFDESRALKKRTCTT